MLQKKVSPSSQLEDLNVVVIDVGLAELFGSGHQKPSRSQERAGTLATMAPEVLMGNFSYKCDIWGIGCMLFAIFNSKPFYIPDGKGGQALYGYPFYPSATEADPYGTQTLLEAQQVGPPMDQVATASSGAKELIWWMLQFDENSRPDAQACLSSAWLSAPRPTGSAGSGVPITRQLLDTLVKDRDHRSWWRAITVQAAALLPASKIEPLARIFEAVDLDGDCRVDRMELAVALRRLGVPAEAAENAAIAADYDNDGLIEWSEFVACCLPASKELFGVALQVAFQSFDLDNDGSLDKNEVMHLLQSGQIDTKHLPSSRTVEAMVEELDRDHNGRISFAEFHDYFMHADGGNRA